MKRLLAACIAVCGTLLGAPVAAQNTGGIFGPVVNEGHRSWQGRSTYDLDGYGFANRLHYQQAHNGDLMWRIVAQVHKTEDSTTDFDYGLAELFWQLSDDTAFWQTGVRFDLRVRGNDRPELFGFNWMNQFQLTPRLEARVLVLLGRNFGSGASSDVSFQTRGHLSYGLSDRTALGFEFYNSWGAVDDFRDFDDQQHQLGPFATVRLGGNWSLFAGALFGVTDSTSDAELRLWLTKDL